MLLIVQHHSITDGMSLAVLNRDLAAAYTAVLGHTAPQWRPLAASYIDYAAWQRRHYGGKLLQVQSVGSRLPSPSLLIAPLPQPLFHSQRAALLPICNGLELCRSAVTALCRSSCSTGSRRWQGRRRC